MGVGRWPAAARGRDPAHLLHVQADHGGGGADALRGGRLPAHGPDHRLPAGDGGNWRSTRRGRRARRHAADDAAADDAHGGLRLLFTQHPVDAAYRQANLFASEDLDAFVDAAPACRDRPARRALALQRRQHAARRDRRADLREPFGAFLARASSNRSTCATPSSACPTTSSTASMTNHVYDREPAAPVRWTTTPASTSARRAMGFEWGGGGLFSTLRDYMRFAEMLRPRRRHDGVRLLSRRPSRTRRRSSRGARRGARYERPTLPCSAISTRAASASCSASA